MTNRIGQDVLQAITRAGLALTLVAGSAFVWIGVPLGGLWLAGRITTDANHFLLFTLCAIPTAMVVFGWLLYRLNRLYEGMRAERAGAAVQRSAWLRSSSDARRLAREGPRPLIDMAMTASAWAAVILMATWFFFFAELRLVSW